jgi:signal transduction histidine kinase
VEDLRDGRAGALPDSARKRLDSVLSNGRRLTTLVEQLLDVARLESGTMAVHAEVRDIVPLLRRVAESFASMAERKGIAFRVSCPVGGMRVRHDPDHLEKVVGNLLGNALKFTPAGGQVELRAHVDAAEANGWAVLEVEDTGPGIPEAHQSRVFERFYQVDDSARRAHEGTGIGLALARELVELHDGTVSLRSVVGAGSTFIVRLPLVRCVAATHHQNSRPGGRRRGANRLPSRCLTSKQRLRLRVTTAPPSWSSRTTPSCART